MDEQTPHFEHDCTRCIYLGDYVDSSGDLYDLYYADHGGLPDTIIARWSSNGPHYLSGMAFGKTRPESPLGEAYRRAIRRGFIKE